MILRIVLRMSRNRGSVLNVIILIVKTTSSGVMGIKTLENSASADGGPRSRVCAVFLINFLAKSENWSERSACASGQHLGGHYFR